MNYIASPKKSIAHSSFLSFEFRTKQAIFFADDEIRGRDASDLNVLSVTRISIYN